MPITTPAIHYGKIVLGLSSEDPGALNVGLRLSDGRLDWRRQVESLSDLGSLIASWEADE